MKFAFKPEDWMDDLIHQLSEVHEPENKYGDHIYGFEKLIVWSRSLDLVELIYEKTATFPGEEKFILTSQIRRAANSIPSNIAEGSGRMTGKDRCRFLIIAYSSAIELLNHVIIAYRLGYFEQSPYLVIRKEIQEITAMLVALHRNWSK